MLWFKGLRMHKHITLIRVKSPGSVQATSLAVISLYSGHTVKQPPHYYSHLLRSLVVR